MTCMQCLSRFSCSGALVKMYQEEAEKCPYLKNKADFVEVVRCKDCKYKTFEQANNIIHCDRDRKHGTMFFKPDSFCSYGERK